MNFFTASKRLTSLTENLVDAQRATQLEAIQQQAAIVLQSTVETSDDYQKSLEVISNTELYLLLQRLAKTRRNDFQRANPADPNDLWRYRAAMTFALGPDYDYGIDALPLDETAFDDLNWDFDSDSIRTATTTTIKPKTAVLNLLRQEYLQTLAKHSHE